MFVKDEILQGVNVIKKIMSDDDIVTATDNPAHKFIMAGLHAARHSHGDTRLRILKDVAQAMDCETDALKFLFANLSETDSEDAQTIYDFPDAERRRAALDARCLTAAE